MATDGQLHDRRGYHVSYYASILLEVAGFGRARDTGDVGLVGVVFLGGARNADRVGGESGTVEKWRMKLLMITLALLLVAVSVTADAQLPWCAECVAGCVNETGAPVVVCEQVCAGVCPVEFVFWLPVVGR